MDKLIIEQDNKKNISTYNLYKIKYLQKEIKHFLKKKKVQKSINSSNKSTKQTGSKLKQNQDKNTENNLIIHNLYNSHSKKSSSKSQNFNGITQSKNSFHTKSNKNGSSPKNKSPKNKSPKNRSPSNKSPKNRSPKSRSPKNKSPKNKSPKSSGFNV